jgi:hypothetical protein
MSRPIRSVRRLSFPIPSLQAGALGAGAAVGGKLPAKILVPLNLGFSRIVGLGLSSLV